MKVTIEAITHMGGPDFWPACWPTFWLHITLAI